jgi:hypothetical protein
MSTRHKIDTALSIPVIVLSADSANLQGMHRRSLERGIQTSLYIEEMFATAYDAANRAVFAQFTPDDAKLVGACSQRRKDVGR